MCSKPLLERKIVTKKKHPLTRPAKITRKEKGDVYFAAYYAMGVERSLSRLHEYITGLGGRIGSSTIFNYSSEFDWQARIVEMDAKVQAGRETDIVTKIQAMNDRQAALGRGWQGVGAQRLKQLQKEPDTLTPAEALQASATGVKIERLATGQPTERKEVIVLVWNHFAIEVSAILTRALQDIPEEYRLPASEVFSDAFNTLSDKFLQEAGYHGDKE